MIVAPVWFKLVLGVVALDLFTYFAHVLLHKSWLGWQFHRVHHSENAVDVTTAFRQHPGETVLANTLAVSSYRCVWFAALGRDRLPASFNLKRPVGTRQYQDE
jgi:sterol desaturase/sphingolipid hydroxylase (fatty acid hydroxylase superfamily)